MSRRNARLQESAWLLRLCGRGGLPGAPHAEACDSIAAQLQSAQCLAALQRRPPPEPATTTGHPTPIQHRPASSCASCLWPRDYSRKLPLPVCCEAGQRWRHTVVWCSNLWRRNVACPCHRQAPNQLLAHAQCSTSSQCLSRDSLHNAVTMALLHAQMRISAPAVMLRGKLASRQACNASQGWALLCCESSVSHVEGVVEVISQQHRQQICSL